MTYEQILNSSLLHLPISHNSNTFRTTIKNCLDKYLEAINTLDNGPLNIKGLGVTGSYVKSVQNLFVNGLLETIDFYYDGYPEKAFTNLKGVINNELKDFREILKIRQFEVNENFYRIRLKKENYPLSPLDMFHIPFQLRGLVTTQRYSIPGFPCLYLGSSIYACWEELNRPNINDFQAIRLESTERIQFLDLTTPPYKAGDDLKTRDIYHYLMTWPLIACCSVKVKDYSHTFKPEYIIPQLLLQWVRGNSQLDGIKYNSTHIDIHQTLSVGDFSNLVMPVKCSLDEGHCTELKAMFKTTNTISIQLKDFAIGGISWIGGDVHPSLKIEKLELVKGMVYPYHYSKLGSLEQFLLGMDVYPMK